MSGVAISIKDLYKTFRVYNEKPMTLKDKFLRIRKNVFKEFTIVNNISLDINKGEMIGLIGENGSGKSTLLKLLTKIIYPNSGSININGRVSSLLELGAGFHPDFTGKENIFMNASIFGLTKKEINNKLDEIIAFAELGDFIYNPVRTYSSGMYMRLAFATAINLEPEILLIDEVLAVGDASFQRKCLNKITELKNNGKTIVLVTHDHGVVERMCDRAVWIQEGKIRKDGVPKDVVNSYLHYLAEKDVKNQQLATDASGNEERSKETSNFQAPPPSQVIIEGRWGSKEIEILNVKLNHEDLLYDSLDFLNISIEYKINTKLLIKPVFGVAFHTLDKIRVYGTNTNIDGINLESLSDAGIIRFSIPQLNLIDSEYQVDVAVHDVNGNMFDYIPNVCTFRVISNERDLGIYKIPHTWII